MCRDGARENIPQSVFCLRLGWKASVSLKFSPFVLFKNVFLITSPFHCFSFAAVFLITINYYDNLPQSSERSPVQEAYFCPDPTDSDGLFVFTPGTDPKPTRLNLNCRLCVMHFCPHGYSPALFFFFRSTLKLKIALFRIGCPVVCFDTQTLTETLFILSSSPFSLKAAPPPNLIQTAA